MTDIKLFSIKNKSVSEIPGETSNLEKHVQQIFENNLDTFIGVRFLASEYAIKRGQSEKGGRMDTLGIDQNKCPVIIEYKRNAHENIITQGLFYLDWLMDHQADFELLVKKRMGDEAAEDVNWTAPRLICIAGSYSHYDKHAVKQMDRNIELIQYERFGEDLMVLHQLTATTAKTTQTTRAGSRTTGSRTTGTTGIRRPGHQKENKQALAEASTDLQERYQRLTDFLLDIGDDVQEIKLKYYTAFKRIKNFACLQMRNKVKHIVVWVPLDPNDLKVDGKFVKDVRKIGHQGTGDVQITIASDEDLERAKGIIRMAYDK